MQEKTQQIVRSLRLGVLGYGNRGELAAQAHRPERGDTVVVVCDPSAVARERAREFFGPGLVTVASLEELLLEKPDAVFVLTPDWQHEEQAVRLLEAGIAVYLEKPMAITTAGCDRVLRTAARSASKLYVGHNMRHMAFVREMKRLVDEGAIGEIKAVWSRHFVGHGGEFFFRDWHAERRRTTSLLIQKGAHDIDVIHWLAGGYSRLVHAFGTLAVYGAVRDRRGDTDPLVPWTKDTLNTWPPKNIRQLNPVIDVEDISMMQMTLANGVLASYLQCHFTPDYWRSYVVVGDEGRIENFGDGEKGTVIKLWNQRKAGYADADATFQIEAPADGHGGADGLITAEFLRFVREGGSTATSPIAARYAVAAGDAGTQSLRNGGVPIEVPDLDPVLRSHFIES